MSALDFLKADLDPKDLEAALRVIRSFKECESTEEWGATPFDRWMKLEQLEEFLAHRVEGAPLADDTLAALPVVPSGFDRGTHLPETAGKRGSDEA
jgi:hypothetical protein